MVSLLQLGQSSNAKLCLPAFYNHSPAVEFFDNDDFEPVSLPGICDFSSEPKADSSMAQEQNT